jgi:hypothetical protein
MSAVDERTRSRTEQLGRVPLHPLLFAAYAVLFLYAANLDEVLPVDVAHPLILSLAGAGIVLAVLGLIYRSPVRGAILASALVVGFFAFGHVSAALVPADAVDVAASAAPRPQLVLAWVLLIVAAAVFAARAGRGILHATAGLNILGVVLVLLAMTTILPYEAGRIGHEPIAEVRAMATHARIDRKPDIYYLVFDRYGSADAIERRFGITDNDLYGWLEERGFQVPAVSRASYRATDFSLASTLNMRYLDELTTQVGRVSSDRTPAQQLLRSHDVGRFLKSQGYRYYNLGSWFDPTMSNDLADVNLRLGATSEFESVLMDTTALPAVEQLLGEETAEPTFLDRHRDGTLFEFRQLHRIATAPGPKFVFAHVLLPHDPYVFRADGTLVTEAEAHAEDEPGLYAGHLAYANARIKQLVTDLLSGPESSRPVVIVQADEGPLACRSVDCVGETAEYFKIRSGVLNAMYLPGIEARLPERFTSVNTFRFVFREYFGADLPPLPDRVFTWPDNDHLYDFRDVTDLVDSTP